MPSFILGAFLLVALIPVAATAPPASLAGRAELKTAVVLRSVLAPPVKPGPDQVAAPNTASANAEPRRAVIPFGTGWG